MSKQSKEFKDVITQTMWETWFIFSITVLTAIVFVMYLPESRDIVELPYLLASCVINLLVCLYVGFKPRY